jgi:hypothetical protein
MASDNVFRPRLPRFIQEQVRRVALSTGKTEDEVVKAVVTSGLRMAPPLESDLDDLTTIAGCIAATKVAVQRAEELANAADKHCADKAVQALPELHGLLRRSGMAMREFALGARAALDALPERYRA